MLIATKIYEGGGIDCLDNGCPYKRECANHRTAGDYRSEGGFTPDLFEDNGQFFCRTKTLPANQEISYGSFPSESMGQGELIFKDGELRHNELQ